MAQPPLTVINDAAWSHSAATLDLSRARLPAPSARLSNVSIRARAGGGANTLVAGVVVQGASPLPLLVRAIGPGLAKFGVSEFLSAPRLEVFRGAALAAQTNAVGSGGLAASAYVGAFPPLENSGGLTLGDAALVGQVLPGAITARCSSTTEASGLALLECYDATAAPSAASPRVVNFSARARVETGENIIVLGFVVTGEGGVTLLLRGVGPSLAQFGVAGFLNDPVIELYAGRTLVAANDNWQAEDPDATDRVKSAGQAAGAFGLASPDEAAMLVTLRAGAYTLQVRGAVGPARLARVETAEGFAVVVVPGEAQTGMALAEIYEVTPGGYDAAQAVNTVGLDLFREVTKAKPGENIIISPYSMESSLALLYAGAEGETREEMARVLRFPAENASLQAGFAGLRRGLEKTAEDSKRAVTSSGLGAPSEWNVANRLFGQQGYAFRDSFLTTMRDGFAAPFQVLDFRANPEASRVAINTWVDDQTRQKIKNLIPPGEVDPDTRLVLVNALYLKAHWYTPFSKASTQPRAFYPTPGTSRDVPTMQQKGVFGHAVDDGFTLVTLDYVGHGLQFIIALPDEGQTVDAAAARLTPEHFARWANLSSFGTKEVDLYLPKFRVEGATIRLGAMLRALGVKQAFNVPRGSANFDGIAPRRPDDSLMISDVFHQTLFALDEEGTEAAAATGIVTPIDVSITLRPPPVEVRVNRPFLCAVRHRASGAYLFFGRVMDPR